MPYDGYQGSNPQGGGGYYGAAPYGTPGTDYKGGGLPYMAQGSNLPSVDPYKMAFNATPWGGADTTAYGQMLRKQMPGLLAGPGGAMGPVAGEQAGYVRALQAQMAGNGPSLAQGQLQQGLNTVQQQAAGAIASQRGINPALAARQILQTQGQASQQMAGQAAQLRSQEQLAASGMLGNALGMQRGQDLSQQGINLNTVGTLGGLQQNQNDLLQRGYLGAQDINARLAMVAQENEARRQAGDQAFNSNLIGGLIGGAGSAAAAYAGKAAGGEIPGKAEVSGDSPRNDKVPAKLSPGEIVLPRSVAQAADAPEKAAAFVRAIRRQGGPDEKPHYGHVLKAMRESNARLARIEQHLAQGGPVQSTNGAAGWPPIYRPQPAPYPAPPPVVHTAPPVETQFDPVAFRRMLMSIPREATR